MNSATIDELARNILPEPWYWVSGPYLYEPGPWMSFVIFRATEEVKEISVYDYTFVGLGPMEMLCRQRLIVPTDAEVGFLYTMGGAWGPDLEREVQLAEALAELEADDSDLEEIELLGKTFCRFLEPLVPLKDSGRTMDDLAYVDVTRFEEKWPGLKDLDTPAFWD